MKHSRRTNSRSTAFESDNFFTNAASQDFAYRVSERGIDEIVDTLAPRTMRSTGHIQRVLTACELLAAANGNAKESPGRCALIDEWLFHSGYVPDDTIMELATERLQRIMAMEHVASD